MDPYSDRARADFVEFYERNNIGAVAGALGADAAHGSLLRLTELVLSWNRRLNLISRKDCTAPVVYHRHILPSVALLPLVLGSQPPLPINDDENDSDADPNERQLNIVDIGTGGGFPGLPLALLLPSAEFTLVDSVRKKLVAVSEMAAELEAGNVRVHWGRAEEMHLDLDLDLGDGAAHEGVEGAGDIQASRRKGADHRGRYDVVLGRSVAALPRFCAWVAPLLKRKGKGRDEEGRLIYIIGGELEDLVESRTVSDAPLDSLLRRAAGTSDKRALVFRAPDVAAIATESGETSLIVRSGPSNNNKKNKSQKKKNKAQRLPRGAWAARGGDVKKQRGYEDFQRFES